jgi:hypothetical protein
VVHSGVAFHPLVEVDCMLVEVARVQFDHNPRVMMIIIIITHSGRTY